MNRAVKKFVNGAIIVCVCIIAVVLVVGAIAKMAEWEGEVPDDFLVIKEEGGKVKHKEKDFPKVVTFDYSMGKGIDLTGEDKLMSYGSLDDGYTYEFFALEEIEEGFEFKTGDKKGYPFEDTKFFGITKPFSFEKKTGKLSVEFLTQEQYENFVDDMTYGENWRDVIKYYEEKEKSPE